MGSELKQITHTDKKAGWQARYFRFTQCRRGLSWRRLHRKQRGHVSRQGNPLASRAGPVHLISVLLGGPVLLADSDLLALADSVCNFNRLRGQEVGLPLSLSLSLSLARVSLAKVVLNGRD